MKNKWVKIGMAILMVFCMMLPFGTAAFADDEDWDVPSSLVNPNNNSNVEESPVTRLGSWLAGQLMYLYVLLVAVVAIIFVVKHQYSKLAAFLVIAIIVAIPIFAPDALPKLAQSISKALKGN